MKTSITTAIEPLREVLLKHPLYEKLNDLADIRQFMEFHVFAVWDFMSLLKGLQRGITCVDIPWLPKGEPRLRRLVNEIVLGEESDLSAEGETASHFELYMRAMREAGADTEKMEQFISHLAAGKSVHVSAQEAGIPTFVQQFMEHTFTILSHGRLHEIASAFTYGREDLIPDMFGELVAQLDREFPGKLTTLRYYFERHIELDGDEHGALGREMVDLLCGSEPTLQMEAKEAALLALNARIKLWDGIYEHIAVNTAQTL